MAHDINDLIGKKITKIDMNKSGVCIHVEGNLKIEISTAPNKNKLRPMDFTKLKEKLRSRNVG